MNKRELRLDKYGISRKRYKELCGFCEQYPEWKQKLKQYTYISARKIDGQPKSPNTGTDTTADAAIRLSDMESNCKLIEEVADKAGGDLARFIIKSACYEVPITYLIGVDEMPCEKSAFYEARRYFFYLLDGAKR